LGGRTRGRKRVTDAMKLLRYVLAMLVVASPAACAEPAAIDEGSASMTENSLSTQIRPIRVTLEAGVHADLREAIGATSPAGDPLSLADGDFELRAEPWGDDLVLRATAWRFHPGDPASPTRFPFAFFGTERDDVAGRVFDAMRGVPEEEVLTILGSMLTRTSPNGRISCTDDDRLSSHTFRCSLTGVSSVRQE
jgi:hypothetical protein